MIAKGMVNAEDIADFASKISSRSHRLINIIEDIIRLSEFDESKVGKDFTTFDIHELAEQVMDSLQEKATEKEVAIKLTGQPLQVQANSRLLEELLTNLIDNGIKYNKVGGSVTVNICEENGFCKISVSDTGIGISKKHHSRIFERFYRVDSSRSKKTGGTGLGLSIVKHIAEHHNGRAVMDSTIGKGTTFICYISL